MTLESKLRALVAKVKAARNGFLDGMPYILTYGDIIADLEALLAERQEPPVTVSLSAEQVKEAWNSCNTE